jgi:putative peptidoglycan lipid II flippase
VSRPRTVGRAAVDMGVATAVSRGFGLLRVLVVAAVLGTTYLGNTFQASNSVANVLFELVAAGALSAVLVPTFVDLFDRHDEAEAERLAGGLLGIALIGLGVIAVLGIVFAPALARALTSGNDNAVIAAQQRELSTYLLRFFVPQILLYAYGAIATAVLYARRRFAITAAAPIASSLVVIVCLVAFRIQAGPHPGFDLTGRERFLLAVAGTGGAAAFVGVLAIACRATGFRLRPQRPDRDPAVRRLLGLSFWGVFLNAGTGLLLAAALVIGNSVAGGVVAYQAAFVFFLAPYAILAQPILTAILPEISREAARGDLEAFAASVRRALDSMALLVVPVSIAFVVSARPAMTVIAFGAIDRHGVELLAAGVASLGIGLYAYGAFLLSARAYYALGDSRTPAIAAIASAVSGVVVMVLGAAHSHGAATVAALGLGHSFAYVVGAVALGVGLSRRSGRSIVPGELLRASVVAGAVGAAAWLAMRAIAPRGRVESLVSIVLVGGAAAAVYVVVLRVSGARLSLRPVPHAD